MDLTEILNEYLDNTAKGKSTVAKERFKELPRERIKELLKKSLGNANFTHDPDNNITDMA